MGFGSWIIDKAKGVQSACVDTCGQIEAEVRALPARAKNLVKKAGKYFFSKGNVPSRKSIAETEWDKYLTKSEILAYNEHTENFYKNKESTPAQVRAFIKVQSLREKVLAKQGNEITPLSKRESQATDSIIKDKKTREWNAQQKAYNYGMPVLNLISFGGASHLEKARESVDQGKGLSAAGHTTVGLGLTAVGAYFTVAEAGNIAYGGCKWLYRLSKGTLTKAPSVILSAAKTALKTVKNPKVVLESAKAANRAFSKAAGEIVSKTSAGLKNLAAKKLTELNKTASAARSTLGSFRSVRTAGQTLESASGKLIESTSRLLSNIRANPQTYVLKAGAGALGIDWAGNAIKDFKEGNKGSGILNTAFALTAPGMVRFTTPALLASREKLSAVNSAEIREFAAQATQKASRGISDICDKAIVFAKSLPETIKDIPQTLEIGASNIFSRPQLAGAGGYGNIPFGFTPKDKLNEARIVFFAGRGKKGLTHGQIVQALHNHGGNRTAAARELGVIQSGLSQHAKNIRGYSPQQLEELAKESGLTTEQILQAVRDLNRIKGLTPSQIVKALHNHSGNRTDAARELDVVPSVLGWHAKNIRGYSPQQLEELAKESELTKEQILQAIASRN